MDELRFEQDLVRALLRDQHPDLADLELRDVSGGWDNQQFRLGEELAVRLRPLTLRGKCGRGPSRRPPGRASRCGCMVTCIRRTWSSGAGCSPG